VTGRLPKTSDETASFKVSHSFDDLTLDSSSWDLDPECYGMDSSPNLYEPSLPLPTSNLSSNNTSLLSDQLNGLAGGSLSAVVLSSNIKQQLVNNSSSIPSSSPSSKLSSTVGSRQFPETLVLTSPARLPVSLTPLLPNWLPISTLPKYPLTCSSLSLQRLPPLKQLLHPCPTLSTIPLLSILGIIIIPSLIRTRE